jgi:hypothetical protein
LCEESNENNLLERFEAASEMTSRERRSSSDGQSNYGGGGGWQNAGRGLTKNGLPPFVYTGMPDEAGVALRAAEVG